MAAYFPRGQQPFKEIKKKFLSDLKGVERNSAVGLVFVTNQELKNAERTTLATAAAPIPTEILHLEKLVHELDKPENHATRWQYLKISAAATALGPPTAEDQHSLDELFGVLSRVAIANTLHYDFESAWQESVTDPWRAAIHRFADGSEWALSPQEVEDARMAVFHAALEFLGAESHGIDHRQDGFRWLGV